MGTNPKTGQEWYARDVKDVIRIAKAVNVGAGKLSDVSQEDIEEYMAMVEEEIDAMLEPYYYVPIKPFNQYQPDGSTKSVFPGNIRRLAQYWSAGLLLQSEFQQNDPNTQQVVESYISDSRRELFDLVRYNTRIQGAEQKHRLRSAPPTLMPANVHEANF